MSYKNKENIYCEHNIQINTEKTELEKIVMLNENMDINTATIKTDEFTILYSKNGNITFNATDISFNGLIYAPRGKVKINAANVEIRGHIVAESVELNVNNFNMVSDEKVISALSVLRDIQNDAYINIDVRYDEKKYIIDYESNYNLRDIKIYERMDNELQFNELQKSEENENCISAISDFSGEVSDILIEADTVYGDKVSSNIISIKIEADIAVIMEKRDSDDDGIQDGYEIWYTKTNPFLKDTDGDGLDDGVEVCMLGTNPNVYTDKKDTDDDGLDDIEEIKLGTNPFLADSDFDGIDDKSDIMPRTFDYKSNRNIKFDLKYQVNEFDKIQIEQNRCAIADQGCGTAFFLYLLKRQLSFLKIVFIVKLPHKTEYKKEEPLPMKRIAFLRPDNKRFYV